MRFFNRGGKNKPITPKKVRDISDDDVNVDVKVNVDNADELEEFAREKAEFANHTEMDFQNDVQKEAVMKLLGSYDSKNSNKQLPILDTNVNTDDKTDHWLFFSVQPMDKDMKPMPNTAVIVESKGYGQGIDDYLTWWNATMPKGTQGYPTPHGILLDQDEVKKLKKIRAI